MVKKILKTTLPALLAIILNNTSLSGCGWFEYEETYRISMFRAEILGMNLYRPFYYTPELMYGGFSPERNSDWITNCKEWNGILGNKLVLNDIYVILYQVNPEMFMLAWQDKNLNETFEGNTFIECLLLPKKNEWLDYLVFAKKNEYNNQEIDDPWNYSYGQPGAIQGELIDIAEQRLDLVKNRQLKERYAYHLVRLYRQAGLNKDCIALYDKYFEKSKNSALKYWAMLHKAEALSAIGKKPEANYLFSLVFNNSSEKRIRAFQLFDKKTFNNSLSQAKNKDEVAGLWALQAIGNPAPALDQIKKVVENNPFHHTIPILIMREVNKLEDWILTPQMTNHPPSLYPGLDEYIYEEDYDKIKETNKIKDLKYLGEFISYIESIQKSLNHELIDYLMLAQAHLNLMANNNEKALALFNQIKPSNNLSIQIQKNIELVLYSCFEKKISNNVIKIDLGKTLINLEKLATGNYDYMKQLHSLCELLSRSFRGGGDVVSASLLKLKAESYKISYESKRIDWYWAYGYNLDYYWGLAYLDRYASTTDIDKLIALTDKKVKTEFEAFITNQPIASKNALMDLKGTLALRNGDIKLALSAFKSVPHEYWDSTYEFKDYLKRNPFLAPNTENHDKPFKFNKADILEQLANLLSEAEKAPSKAVENYIKIGHFFYNVSYWGNSWMMLSYSKTNSPLHDWSGFYDQDILFGNLLGSTANFEESFYKCSLAMQYYQKAEKLTSNKEQKAMVTFMKYCCDLNDYRWEQMHKDWDEKWDDYKPNYIEDLYKNFSDTKTFREIKCSMMDDFAFKIGVY